MVSDGVALSGVISGWVAIGLSALSLEISRRTDKTTTLLLKDILEARKRESDRVDNFIQLLTQIVQGR
jgi:hypothetical protein